MCPLEQECHERYEGNQQLSHEIGGPPYRKKLMSLMESSLLWAPWKFVRRSLPCDLGCCVENWKDQRDEKGRRSVCFMLLSYDKARWLLPWRGSRWIRKGRENPVLTLKEVGRCLHCPSQVGEGSHSLKKYRGRQKSQVRMRQPRNKELSFNAS